MRQLRKDHPDARYVDNILKYLKEFAVTHRPLVRMYSVDVKAIIPVGEPRAAVSTVSAGYPRVTISINVKKLIVPFG